MMMQGCLEGFLMIWLLYSLLFKKDSDIVFLSGFLMRKESHHSKVEGGLYN